MDGYIAKISNVSKDLTAKERVAFKDTTACMAIDKCVTADASLCVYPEYWGTLAIHNENAKGKDKDYWCHIIVDKDGTRYRTGSESLWSAFLAIVEEMAGEDEAYGIEIYQRQSKNYEDKYFLTCSII